MTDEHELLTAAKVARLAGCHENTVGGYTKRGLLTPRVASDRTRLFTQADVDRVRELYNAKGRRKD
jgi:DNA-binding transcriptional MerR regulator